LKLLHEIFPINSSNVPLRGGFAGYAIKS
jgi:hypothetical protein